MTKDELKALRIANLKRFYENKTLPPKDKSLISQLMSGKSSFGEKVSRRLEEEYGMGIGYLDSSNVETHDINVGNRMQKLRTEKGISTEQLAELLDLPIASINEWEAGTSSPKTKYLDKLAEILDSTPMWIQFGDKMMPDAGAIAVSEYVDTSETHLEIQMYEVRLSAGTGNASWIVNHKADPLVFREQWFIAKRLKPDNLRGMYVKGNSMEPVLNDWDTVIIDITDTELVDGNIYALIFKDKLYIKQIRHTEDGVTMISFNPDYEPIEVTPETADRFHVLGKMVWRGG